MTSILSVDGAHGPNDFECLPAMRHDGQVLQSTEPMLAASNLVPHGHLKRDQAPLVGDPSVFNSCCNIKLVDEGELANVSLRAEQADGPCSKTCIPSCAEVEEGCVARVTPLSRP